MEKTYPYVILAQLDKQFEQLKQLREMQSTLPASPMPMFIPFSSPQKFDFGEMQQQEGAVTPTAAAGAGITAGRLRAIKNRVRDSFKKRTLPGGKTHIVNMDNLEEDFGKVKEFIAKTQIKNALAIMEAITEEFADRIAEISQNNIDKIEEILSQLGNHWLDIFLSDSYNLPEDEREDWYEKVRSWDTSAQEGALTTAKWAAKYGWQDEKLKQLLAGEPVDVESYKEPQVLTLARLNILERDKRYQEAYNFAKAVNLTLQSAKFLMKMNKIDEAVTTALRLNDTAQIFNIAQTARPISVPAAFQLAIGAICKDWSHASKEKFNWVCDLAITEKMVPDLVTRVAENVKSKSAQYEIATLLFAKGKPLDAFLLVESIVKPYSHSELLVIYDDLVNRGLIAKDLPPMPDQPPPPQRNRTQLLQAISACNVPNNITSWAWENAVLALEEAKNQVLLKSASSDYVVAANKDYTGIVDELSSKPNEIIELVLKYVDNPDEIYRLMTTTTRREAFAEVDKLGTYCLDVIITQEDIDKSFREKIIEEEFKHQQLVSEALGKGEQAPVFIPPIPDHLQYHYENKKKHICSSMLKAALLHKEQFKLKQQQEIAANNQAANVTTTSGDITMGDSETEEEKTLRENRLNECNKVLQHVVELAIVKLSNPDDLLELAKDMSSRAEYRLSLKIAHKSFNQVSKLKQLREQLDAKFEQYTALQQEINLLLSQKLKPKAEQVDKYREASLERAKDRLIPEYAHCTVKQLIRKWFYIAEQIITTAITSQSAYDQNERLTASEIQKESESVFQYVEHPKNMIALIEKCYSAKEYLLVQYMSDKALGAINALQNQFNSRVPVETEIQLIIAERDELAKFFGKELGDAQKKRLSDLEEQLNKLPEKNLNEFPDTNQFETAIWTIMNTCVQAILSLKLSLESSITSESSGSIDNTNQERIASLKKQLEDVNKQFPVILQKAFDNVNSPFYLYDLISILQRFQQFEFIPKIVSKTFDILVELEKERQSKIPITEEYNKLLTEKNNYLQQPPQTRQPIPQENVERLRQLQLEFNINSIIKTDYHRLTATNIASIMKKIALLEMTILTKCQSDALSQYQYNKSEYNRLLSQQINESAASEIDLMVFNASKEDLKNKSEQLYIQINHYFDVFSIGIEEILNRINGPTSLLSVADLLHAHFGDYFEFTRSKEKVKLRSKLYEKVLVIVKKLEEQRKSRIDVYYKKQLLETEQRELSALLKFPEEKLAELEQLNQQIRVWEQDVNYNNQNSVTHTNLLYDTTSRLLSKLFNDSRQLRNELQQVNIEQETAESLARNASGQQQDTTMGGTEDESSALSPEQISEYNRKRKAIESDLALVEDLIQSGVTLTLNTIKSPEHIIQIGQSLLSFGEHSMEIIIKLTSTVFQISKELADEMKRREPLNDELDDLESQQEELVAVKKSLKGKEWDRLLELRKMKYIWSKDPPYTNVEQKNLNQYNYSAASLLLKSVFQRKYELKQQLELLIQKTRVIEGNTTVNYSVDEIERLEGEVERISSKIDKLVDVSLTNLRSPEHIKALSDIAKQYNELETVFKVSKVNLQRISELDKHRQYLCELSRKIFLIEAENYILEEARETIDPARQKTLEKYRKEFNNAEDLEFGADYNKSVVPKGLPKSQTLTLPDDNSRTFDTTELDLKFRAANVDILLRSALTKQQQFEQRIQAEEQLGIVHNQADVDSEREQLDKFIQDTVEYLFGVVENPQHIDSMYNLVDSYAKHSLKLVIGEKYIKVCSDLREQIKQRKPDQFLLQKLEQEERDLKSQRKTPSQEKKIQLRDLQFNSKVTEVLPPFKNLVISRLNQVIWHMANRMLASILDNKLTVEAEMETISRAPHLVRGKSSWSESQLKEFIDDKQKSVKNELGDHVKLICTFVKDADHLVECCTILNNNKQYPDLVAVGHYSQQILKEMIILRIQYEELQKMLQSERDKLPHGAADTPEIQALAKQIEERQLNLPDKQQPELRRMILQIADYLIDAARIEKMDNVVQEQSILVFKMTLTIPKFDEVHTLVSEKEWPSVRKELLKHVVDYDATLPGAAITTKDQMELLLREGLWEESIRIIPDPPLPAESDFARKSEMYVQILELIWFEMERIAPKQLKKILPLIEEFAKKEFQQLRLNTLDKLLDGVQQFFPDFILPLYETGSEFLLSNATTVKQYKTYCDFALILKRRLCDLKKQNDWKEFIADVRRKNARKKNLIKQLDVNELK